MPDMTVIPGFLGSHHWPNRWTTNSEHALKLGLNSNGQVTVEKNSAHTSHVVLNATPKDFERLPQGRGVPVDQDGAYVVQLSLSRRLSLRVQLVIYEFSAGLEKETRHVVAAGQRHLFVPRTGTSHLVISLRTQGSGSVTIEELEFLPVGRTVRAEPGIHDYETPHSEGDGAEGQWVRDSVNRDADRLATLAKNLAKASTRAVLEATTAPPQSTPQAGVSNRSRRENRELLLELAGTLPESNGSQFFKEPIPLDVAIVTDEYMFNFYKDVFRSVTYVSPATVDAVIAEGYDLLLYVTCWKGMNGEEWRGVKFRAAPAEALDKLVSHAKSSQIPTVFQSIEDPSNLEYFLPIAAKFDYVFTSDVASIDDYKKALNHQDVFYGEYGVNPLLNNPIGSRNHTLNRAFFAGSFPSRYKERVADMEVVFDSLIESGCDLTIADRNAGNSDFEFPLKYQDLCIDPIPHELLQRVHKLYRYNLNFNSIKNSPTMCAMRVYELQANGRGVISNYAKSVLNTFPEIRIVTHPEDLSGLLGDDVLGIEEHLNESQIRNVMTKRTSHDVASTMLRAIGMSSLVPKTKGRIAVLTNGITPELEREISEQTYSDYVVMDRSQFADQQALGEAIAHAGAAYVAPMELAVQYGPNYLVDKLNAFKYTNSDFVGQLALDSNEHRKSHNYTVQATAPEVTMYSMDSGFDAPFSGHGESLRAPSGTGYLTSSLEAKRRNEQILVSEGAEVEEFTPVLSIIVPVFNNGRYLESKCLPSIMRNRRSGEFEILLVDDGSTDSETVRICRSLSDQPHTRYIAVDEDGGSGSASRPRNIGMREARADLISFLDPDNEISDMGYDALLRIFDEQHASNPNVGFVSGYQVKVAEKQVLTGRHTNKEAVLVRDLRDRFLANGKFPVISTQAAVIKRSLLLTSPIEFVEGAAGQDTLFGWELVAASGVGVFTDAAHLIYYAERGDSITNVVGPEYFRKKLVMEGAVVAFLRKEKLLDVYLESHYERFMKNWYLPKLDLVSSSYKNECQSILDEIAQLYGKRLSDSLSS